MYKKIHSVTTNLSHMLTFFLYFARLINQCISTQEYNQILSQEHKNIT